MFDHRKHVPFAPIAIADRTWPDKTMTATPTWCSVDLRDGSQALVNPMDVEQKKGGRYFDSRETNR